jgi:hypothetical protein
MSRAYRRRIAVLVALACVVTTAVLVLTTVEARWSSEPHAAARSGPIRGYAYLQDSEGSLLLHRAYVGLIVLVNDGPDVATLEGVHLTPFTGYPLPATRFYLAGFHPRGLGAEPARGRTFRGTPLTPAIGAPVVGTRADKSHAGTLLVIRADRGPHRVAGWRGVTVVYRYHGVRYRTRYRTGVAMCSRAARDPIC